MIGRSLMVTALTGGLLLGTAACGGAGDTKAAAPKAGSSAGPEGAFRQCLRQHGLALPNQGRATARPSDFPSISPSRRAAFQACASLAPNGGRFGGVDRSALKAFQSCMSRHGVKVTNSFRPGALRTATADPKAAAAFRTCRVLLPGRAAFRPSSSPSPSPSPTAS